MKTLRKSNVILFLLSLLPGLVSCSKEQDELLPAHAESATCRITIVCVPETQTAVPARNPMQEWEARIADLNLWVFNASLGVSRHLYVIGSGTLTLELPAGDYTYYALANAGEDLGELDEAGTKALILTIDPYADLQQGDCLPMASRGSFTALGGRNITISLVRCAARMEINLSVAPEFASQFTFRSVQLLDVPTALRCFADNRVEDLSAVADYPAEEASGTTYHGVFYLTENIAGMNSAIVDPHDRSRANAPRSATCIRVQGTADGRRVDYFIYPGTNTTSDFNVHRNYRYRLEAVITGCNTVDMRISTVEAELPAWNEYYLIGDTIRSLLALSCVNNPDNRFDLSYELVAGSGTVLVDGQELTPGTPLRLLNGGGNRTAEVAYTQTGEGDAALRLTLTDRYGQHLGRELSTTFVKEGPNVTFTQQGDSLYAYEFGVLNVHVGQPGYAGSYTVRSDGEVDIHYGSQGPLREFILPGNGDHSISFTPIRTGLVPIRLTLTDENGRSAQILAQTVGLTAHVQIRSSYEGGGGDPIRLSVQASSPVGEDLRVYFFADFVKLDADGQVIASRHTQDNLTIHKGDTEAVFLPGTGYTNYTVRTFEVRSLSRKASEDGLYVYEIAD